jgi:hypothetical protein
MLTKEREKELAEMQGEEKLATEIFGSQEEKDFLKSLKTEEIEEVEEKPLEKIEIHQIGGESFRRYISGNSEVGNFWIDDPKEAKNKICKARREVSMKFNAWNLQPSGTIYVNYREVVANATSQDEEYMKNLVKQDIVLPEEKRITKSNGYITATFRPVVIRRSGVSQNTSDGSMRRTTDTKFAYLAIEWKLVGVQNLQSEKDILKSVGSVDSVIEKSRELTSEEKTLVRKNIMEGF